MAVITRAHRRRILQSSLIGAAIFAVLAAVVPVVCAALGLFGSNGRVTTAFASAPPGQYAVVARTDGSEDLIAVVSSRNPQHVTDVARISHLPDFGVRGSVSPDGQHVAVIAADGGTPDNPTGSLLVVNLLNGDVATLLSGLDPQQTPVWAHAGDAVVVTRDSGNGPLTVTFLSVPIDGSAPTTIDIATQVLGAYAVGFDKQGRFIDVAIDGRGSIVRRAGQPLQLISTQITRDWQLNADGSQMAFIESSLVGGLHYIGRTVALDGQTNAAVEAQTADAGQQLGVAWQPGSQQATFGQDPASPGASPPGVEAQVAGDGFDLPIAYSRDGSTLAAQHWSGSSFAHAGQSTLELVRGSSRIQLTSFSRFLGWTAR